MGEKWEAFCRKTLSLPGQNLQVVLPNVGLADVQADLATRAQLRPRRQRLESLSERAADNATALGSNVMVTALQGYALLKVVGRNQGLESLSKTLGTRSVKAPR